MARIDPADRRGLRRRHRRARPPARPSGELAWRIDRDDARPRRRRPRLPDNRRRRAARRPAPPRRRPTAPIARGRAGVIDMGARRRRLRRRPDADDLGRRADGAAARRSTMSSYEAQRAALGGAAGRLSGKEADALAREPITAAGYGEQFTHGLGHGLGIRVHEAPSLGKKSEEALQAGTGGDGRAGHLHRGLGRRPDRRRRRRRGQRLPHLDRRAETDLTA